MLQDSTQSLRYNWQDDIAPHLEDIQDVMGGYTPAQRGVVKLDDGTKVFVKIATDTLTCAWLKKEIGVYTKLNGADYRYIPRLLAHNDEQTAMAIEYLDDASFENTWDKNKLDAIIDAQEALKQYVYLFTDAPVSGSVDMHDLSTKWPRILEADNIGVVNRKLLKLGVKIAFTRQQVEAFETKHEGWSLRTDTLTHEDIRADNFGYNPVTKTGKLVDWNWLNMGDPSLDTTPLFINMHLAGFDAYKYHPEKYDEQMIAYLISFWMDSILSGDEDGSAREWRLRLAQAKNLEACLELLARSK